MKTLRFALAGAGFWAQYQLAAWYEVPEVKCVAICDPVAEKAHALAHRFGIERVYTDASEMLAQETLDLVDIVSAVPSHFSLVSLALQRGVATICQKPLTDRYEECLALAQMAKQQNVFLAVHENFRWQSSLRRIRELLAQGAIGTPVRVALDFNTAFDVFGNQPNLRTLERFMIADLGVHLLDVARSWLGEAQSIMATTARVQANVRGEDAATIHLRMGPHSTAVTLGMSYFGAPVLEDVFPASLAEIWGSEGMLRLGPQHRIDGVNRQGTWSELAAPKTYPWADPKYAIVHSSMVPCLTHFADSLRAGTPAETDVWDNLRTMQLVELAYQSAANGNSFQVPAL